MGMTAGWMAQRATRVTSRNESKQSRQLETGRISTNSTSARLERYLGNRNRLPITPDRLQTMSTHPFDEDDSKRDLQVSDRQQDLPSHMDASDDIGRVEQVVYTLGMLEEKSRAAKREDEAAGGDRS